VFCVCVSVCVLWVWVCVWVNRLVLLLVVLVCGKCAVYKLRLAPLARCARRGLCPRVNKSWEPGRRGHWTLHVAPNAGGTPVRNMLYVTFLEPQILMWLLYFWKICTPLVMIAMMVGGRSIDYVVRVFYPILIPSAWKKYLRFPPKFISCISFELISSTVPKDLIFVEYV